MLLTRIITVIGCLFFVVPSYACTIFVLTDSKKTLFFNNEDYSNPATRIWFLPPGKGYYGAAYVGFSDRYEQGGVNTEGLTFDWVAGQKQAYLPAAGLRKVRGNPTERMLESCATVVQAIAFYQQYQDTTFSYATILIADKTGPPSLLEPRMESSFLIGPRSQEDLGTGKKS